MSPIPLSETGWWDRFRRRMKARRVLYPAQFVMPDLAPVHPLKLDWPEEEFFLMENEMVGSTLYYMYQGYEYAQRLISEDIRFAYRSLRRQLQILSGPGNTDRIVLKAPIHLWNLEALCDVFPDAKFVFTHREAVSALVSTCSFCALTTAKAVREMNPSEIGKFWLNYNAVGIERAMMARKRIPEDQQIDVPLAASAKDPVGIVERVFGHFGIETTEEARGAVRHRVQSRQGRPKGKHKYSAGDYGLTEDEIHARFSGYEERYEALLKEWGAS